MCSFYSYIQIVHANVTIKNENVIRIRYKIRCTYIICIGFEAATSRMGHDKRSENGKVRDVIQLYYYNIYL